MDARTPNALGVWGSPYWCANFPFSYVELRVLVSISYEPKKVFSADFRGYLKFVTYDSVTLAVRGCAVGKTAGSAVFVIVHRGKNSRVRRVSDCSSWEKNADHQTSKKNRGRPPG